MNLKDSQKGISLYLSIFFMGVILSIILGMSVILIGQLKITKGLGNSTIAFYAADTGIERILYAIRKQSYDTSTCTPTPCATPYFDTLSNEASYAVFIQDIGPSVSIKSIGSYEETRRAIEITY